MSEDELKGCLIDKIFKIHDYYQIWTDKCIITINNPFTINYKEIINYNDIEAFLAKEENIFKNCIIDKCIIKEHEEFVLILSNEIMIKVFMNEENYISPEPVFIGFYENEKMVMID